MSKARNIRLDVDDAIMLSFRLDGTGTVVIEGETSKGTLYVVTLKVCEIGMRRLSEQIKERFERLRDFRDSRNKDNLEIFGGQ